MKCPAKAPGLGCSCCGLEDWGWRAHPEPCLLRRSPGSSQSPNASKQFRRAGLARCPGRQDKHGLGSEVSLDLCSRAQAAVLESFYIHGAQREHSPLPSTPSRAFLTGCVASVFGEKKGAVFAGWLQETGAASDSADSYTELYSGAKP